MPLVPCREQGMLCCSDVEIDDCPSNSYFCHLFWWIRVKQVVSLSNWAWLPMVDACFPSPLHPNKVFPEWATWADQAVLLLTSSFFSHLTKHVLSQKAKLVVQMHMSRWGFRFWILDEFRGPEERNFLGPELIGYWHDKYLSEICMIIVMFTFTIILNLLPKNLRFTVRRAQYRI